MDKGVPPLNANRRKFFRAPTRLVVLLFCFAWVGWLTASQWRRLTRNERYLAVPLIATSSADYQARRPEAPVAPVGLGVIKDLIHDSQPESPELPVRLATAVALLSAPLPGKAPLPSSLPGKSTGTASRTGNPGQGADPGNPGQKGHTGKTDKTSKAGKADKAEKADKVGKTK
jgi:hypothetical protein